MPAPIVIRNLTPETKMGNESPKIATREDLRSGARGDSSNLPPAAENTIVLTGSNFEAVANPLPSAYDDQTEYGSLSAGSQVPVGDEPLARYPQRPPSHSPSVLDNQIKLPGRPFSIKPTGVKGAVHDLRTAAGGASRSINTLYTSGWMYLPVSPYEDANHDSPFVSFKYCRIWGGNSGKNHFRCSILWRNGGVAEGPQIDGQFTPNPSWWGRRFPAGQYIRVESEFVNPVYDAGNNSYTADYRHLVNGEIMKELTAHIRTEHNSSDVDTGQFSPMRLAMFGSDPNFPQYVDPEFRCHVMEIHEQPTPARVELSNSATWVTDGTMRRFYQRTLTRTDSTIEFEPFYGDLDTGAPIYAYIVKSDGSVNQSGILITSDTVAVGDWQELA